MASKPSIAIVGAGALAQGLTAGLYREGYRITEIFSRETPGSGRKAHLLARQVKARASSISDPSVNASLLWFCVPDRQIRPVAAFWAKRDPGKLRYAFHSSGALSSGELSVLKRKKIAVAAVHPLMTFVPGSTPSLKGVPFVLEGDRPAVAMARSIVLQLGGIPVSIPASRKAAYHTWATMTSPLLLAFLVTLETVARQAGLSRAAGTRMSLPIIRQTLVNYAELGGGKSFSGPLIRGDVETVRKHLTVLGDVPRARETYIALARVALDKLPVKNKEALRRLLRSKEGKR